MRTRLLHVEDSLKDAGLVHDILTQRGTGQVDVTHVLSMGEAEARLAEGGVDIVLLDLGLPDASGLEAVRRCHAAAPGVPLVVLTGLHDEQLAAQVLQEGAQEHLIKGQFDHPGLHRALRYAVERKAMETQRDLMAEALFTEKERAQVTLDCIGDGVACTDLAGNITFLNPVAVAMTGWSALEAAGRPLTEVFRVTDGPARRAVLYPELQALPVDPVPEHPSTRVLVRRDSFETPIELSVAEIHDRHRRPTGAVIVFRDVRAARAMALKVAHSSEHDSLTGLPNRSLLTDRLTHAIAVARRHTTRLAVLFLDLNSFKHINDSLGHATGDKLLQSVATRLVECVRASDTVSRPGGDEFVVLLSDLDQAVDAALTARRLLDAVAEMQSVDEHDLHVTASIGLSIYPDDGLDAETLIKNADVAMYQAKDNGLGSYRFFDPAMNVGAIERQWIEQGIRTALGGAEFTLHYQPRVDLRSGAIIGAEALIRWTHPVHGPVSPARFIPVAEDCGMILPIGRWVLRDACTRAKAWADAGLFGGTLSVNVSAVEFLSRHFLRDVVATLAETGFDPGSLELELTETVLMKHATATEAILKALRDTGVKLAVDDFGTGYSSLSYLRRFPITCLKIDKSFIGGVGMGREENAIVKAVIGMGRGLSLQVVAEGVETQEQLGFLHAHECDEAQGYYFSHPLPPERFTQLLRSGLVPGAPRRQVSALQADGPIR